MADKQKVTRKLRAILSADVKDYSRLMSDDESYTIQTLKAYQNIMTAIIEKHSGRVVDTPGDNLLAEFSSIVNAVQSAVEIQKTLKQENTDIPIDKKLEFRIGVNIGDVIQDGERLYGDGVNIAARIEGLADPGGVCISRGAYDHIRNKLKLGYEYIGEHSVKNIKHPVRIYKLLMKPADAGKLIGDEPRPLMKPGTWATVIIAAIVLILIGYQVFQKLTVPEHEPASIEEMAFPLPEKPSIAVLPFDNMSDDPNQEFFCDGISEDIITALSKAEELFVISRNSTFTYKGKPTRIKQIAEDLGVRYVLEGSVRKTEDRVRITAQLIDAISGNHLWAERYDRDIKDIFKLQDEITMKILNALQVKLTEGEQTLMWRKRYKTLDMKLKAMEAYSHWKKGTKADVIRFGQISQELIDMAPESEVGYNQLAWYYWALAKSGVRPDESIKNAFELAQKALSLDESQPFVYSLLGNLYSMIGQHDKAIATAEKGVTLYPNGTENHCALGITLSWAGRLDEAISHFRQAIRLDPFPQWYYYRHLSRCYMHKGDYDKALSEIKKALHTSTDSVYNLQLLAAIYALLDRQAEAQAIVKKILEKDPNYSLERISRGLPYKNKADLEFRLDAMRKAGIPEKTPIAISEKPSIAVLPFDNMSGDPDQEYFIEAFSENLITELARNSMLAVIARHSSFKYRGKGVDLNTVTKDLGVDWIVEGSLMRSAEDLRVTVQLIETKNFNHTYSEKYDFKLKEMFDVQDEITQKIIAAMHVKIIDHTIESALKKKDIDLDSMDLFWRGQKEFYDSFEESGIEKLRNAQKLYKKAIEHDPDNAFALSSLVWTIFNLYKNGAADSEDLKLVYGLAKRARDSDSNNDHAQSAFGFVNSTIGNDKLALASYEKTLKLNPNNAATMMHYAYTLANMGQAKEGIKWVEKAMELNPIPPSWYATSMSVVYYFAGEYQKTIDICLSTPYSENPLLLRLLTACHSHLGKIEQAKDYAKQLMIVQPTFSLKWYEEYLSRNKDKEAVQNLVNAMRAVGLTE